MPLMAPESVELSVVPSALCSPQSPRWEAPFFSRELIW